MKHDCKKSYYIHMTTSVTLVELRKRVSVCEGRLSDLYCALATFVLASCKYIDEYIQALEYHPEIKGRRNAISIFLDHYTEKVKEIIPGHRQDIRHMRHAITGIDFDPQGTNFATVDVDGFLSINDVSSLYERSLNSHWSARREHEDRVEICSIYGQFVTLSASSSFLYLFYLNGQRPIIPREIETYRPEKDPIRQCLTDIALPDQHSIIAAGKEGSLFFVDDRYARSIKRFNVCPNDRINSIEVDPEKQVVFAATESYRICGMDVRALREPPHQNAYLLNISVEDELRTSNKVKVPKCPLLGIVEGVHCIKLDPSCPYNLGFTLTYGWLGIIDLHTSQITKMFCPLRCKLTANFIRNPLGSRIFQCML